VKVAERLYAELAAAGIEVLYDDRDARPGVSSPMREDAGRIPARLVVWRSAASMRASSEIPPPA